MLTEQRYEEIYNLLEREGSVRTIVLCDALQTSRETIRRDLENMEAKGMLRRIRGGAMKLEGSQDKNSTYTSFSKRREENFSIPGRSLCPSRRPGRRLWNHQPVWTENARRTRWRFYYR